MTRSTVARGRTLHTFVGRVLKDIKSGKHPREGFLPSIRALAKLYDTSPETARRGLKLLVERGILISEGYSGFRVAPDKTGKSTRSFAFVTGRVSMHQQPATGALSLALQKQGAKLDWPCMSAYGDEASDPRALVEQLLASNVWGIVLDSIDEKLFTAVAGCGLPVVAVNSWVENSQICTVIQDNYRGGFIAAEHLVNRGARNVAWAGTINQYCHSRERFAGASARLRLQGIRITDSNCCADPRTPEGAGELARMLKSDDRPDAIIAFMANAVSAIRKIASECGLELGRDLDVVSWITEECYEQHYQALFEGDRPAPAIVWSAATMAERALSLLAEISDGMIQEPVRVCIPTRLKGGSR